MPRPLRPSFATSGLKALHVKHPHTKALEAIHSPPVGSKPFTSKFFFHECGRRVGMVPRSSLKEGKYNQMVQKGQRKQALDV